MGLVRHTRTVRPKKLAQWIELNRNTLIQYWSGEIEYTEEVLRVLKPMNLV